MTSADKIASHGRTGSVSALSIASWGRLARRLITVAIDRYRTEIIRLNSAVHRILDITSKVGK